MLKATAAGDPVERLPGHARLSVAAASPPVRSLAYLQQAGVPAEQRPELNTGPNPGCTTPSSYNLPHHLQARRQHGNTGVAADLGVTGGLGANGPGGTVGK